MGNASASSINEDLLLAVKKGELDKVKQLCSNAQNSTLDINYQDENLATPIMWACYMGHIKMIDLLISFGGNLTDCDKDNYTALHYAVTQKQKDVVKLLVINYKNKMNINAKNNQGDTALHRSVHYSLKNIASILITNGAEINALNNLQETPLDKARTNDIKNWLKSLGGKNNAKKSQVEGGDNDIKNNDNDNYKLSKDDKQFLLRSEMKNKVIEWLKIDLSLPEYINNFVDNGYDRFDAIISMDKDDLKEIGVKMGHMKIMLKSIEEYKINQQNIQQYDKANQPGMNQENKQIQPEAEGDDADQ